MSTQNPTETSILICDDSPDTLSFMEFFLRRQGFATCVAADFEQLLDCLSKRNYDLLIQDVRMPGMSGFDVVEELKNRQIRLPVLFATGVEPSKFPNYPTIPGVREYIVKPFDNQMLLARIEKMLGSKGA